jgi:transposase-like protein
MGITLAGNKEIRGIFAYFQKAGSAQNKEISLLDRKERETHAFVTDGLTRIREAKSRSVFLKADHLVCPVHLVRNVSNSIRVEDREQVLEDLKAVDQAIDLKIAQEAMKDLKNKLETIDPKFVKRFDDELLCQSQDPHEVKKDVESK